MSKKREQRQRMWEYNKHCHFCNVETVLTPHTLHETQPDNCAVLKLAFSRYDRRRHSILDHSPEKRRVLCCRKCADRISREEAAAMPLDILHALANNHKDAKQRKRFNKNQ